MLDVQKFIFENSLEKLIEEYHINVKQYDNCIIFNYDQIDSPKFVSEVEDCRGLILSKDCKEVYAKPFKRFYNFYEKPVNVNFNTSYVEEKVDGSLISLYYNSFEKKWNFATRGMAYAEGMTNYGTNTFYDLILKCLNDFTDEKISEVMKDYIGYTFNFELTTPENRVVKSYGTEYCMYFLGCHKNNGEFISPDICSFWNDFIKKYDVYGIFSKVKLPMIYDLKSMKAIEEFISTLESTDEGFVVYDYVSNIRFKMKNPRYLEISHMRMNGKISFKTIIKMIIENEQDEYLSYFPDDKFLFEPYIVAYNKLCDAINADYMKYMDVYENGTRKDLALSIKDIPYRSILFRMYDGETNVHKIMNGLSEDSSCNLVCLFK